MTETAESTGGPVRVLLVDDDEDDYILTRDLFAELGAGRFSLDWVPSYEQAADLIGAGCHDVFLLDYNLGARTGLDLLRHAIDRGCDGPLILLTGQGDHAIDVEAMRCGAADYLPKSRMEPATLERSIRFALERKRNEAALKQMRDDLEHRVQERTADLQRVNARLREEVAERRHAEDEVARLLQCERQARAAAEAADRSKDRFLAMLSHELRTPLNPVLLAASALAEDPEAPESARASAALILRHVELEARLIDDLLDVTRIRSGKLPLDRRALDLHEVIRHAVEICRPDLDAAGLSLEADLSASGRVSGDPARLQQVTWNLLKNAAKFTPPGGVVRVSTRDDPAGGEVVVEVSDTGIGLEAAALERIFDPFEQVGDPAHLRPGGLGLGLAIARSVAEAHGGSIRAESRGPGLGSRFLVRLPSAPMPARAAAIGAAPSRPDRPRPSARTILLIEDDPASLDVLSRLLRSEGHVVLACDSGPAALAQAERVRPDLIISDLGLPGLSGYEVLRRLSALGPIPAIALTGFGTDNDVRLAREAGFSSHLTKPITFGKLRDLIRELG